MALNVLTEAQEWVEGWGGGISLSNFGGIVLFYIYAGKNLLNCLVKLYCAADNL